MWAFDAQLLYWKGMYNAGESNFHYYYYYSVGTEVCYFNSM